MNAQSRTLLLCVWLAFGLAGFSLCAAADEPDRSTPSRAKPASALDQQLLEGLDNELLEGLDDLPAEKPKSEPVNEPTAKGKADATLDDDLLRDLSGEDVGGGASQDPLAGIGRRMRGVESRLSKKRLDRQTTQIQQSILDDLAVLLQECKKQCQGGGSGKGGSGKGGSGKPGTGSEAGKRPAAQAPSDTARNSSDKLRDRQTELGENGALVNAMKESWGNLPEHARKHFSNVNTDAFLPKYEIMLEKYFKRLGEEDANRP